MIMAFGYTCSLVAANCDLSKQTFACLQVCFVALLKRCKGNVVFGHRVGRTYPFVYLARQNKTLCCFENTLFALFAQKLRFCASAVVEFILFNRVCALGRRPSAQALGWRNGCAVPPAESRRLLKLKAHTLQPFCVSRRLPR